MEILCLTHADFETPGVIANWAKINNHRFTLCQPYRGEDCLAHTDFDFLLIMGGPQSPLKLTTYPYLKDEIKLIQHAVAADKIILGFCLGAQLIGEALGAKTQKSPEKEVGVFPISLTEEGESDPLLQGFPTRFPVIHWHNDMPGDTITSTILAYSEGCPKQIIRYDSKIYGFQCHLEINQEGINQLIAACPADLQASTFTQTAEQLIHHNYDEINQKMFLILDRLIQRAGSFVVKKAV